MLVGSVLQTGDKREVWRYKRGLNPSVAMKKEEALKKDSFRSFHCYLIVTL